MGGNIKLFALVLTVLVLITLSVLRINKNENSYKPRVSSEEDRAVAQAKVVYERKKEAGIDFSSGPCLTNDLMPGWVLDVAHDPRESIDNLIENQCQAFIEGRSKHFVEFDPQGNLIRVK